PPAPPPRRGAHPPAQLVIGTPAQPPRAPIGGRPAHPRPRRRVVAHPASSEPATIPSSPAPPPGRYRLGPGRPRSALYVLIQQGARQVRQPPEGTVRRSGQRVGSKASKFGLARRLALTGRLQRGSLGILVRILAFPRLRRRRPHPGQ